MPLASLVLGYAEADFGYRLHVTCIELVVIVHVRDVRGEVSNLAMDEQVNEGRKVGEGDSMVVIDVALVKDLEFVHDVGEALPD